MRDRPDIPDGPMTRDEGDAVAEARRRLSDRLGETLLAHATWMVESGQFLGTVGEYLGYLHPSPGRDEAVRRAMLPRTEAD